MRNVEAEMEQYEDLDVTEETDACSTANIIIENNINHIKTVPTIQTSYTLDI